MISPVSTISARDKGETAAAACGQRKSRLSGWRVNERLPQLVAVRV
jgi:hypothetical protein